MRVDVRVWIGAAAVISAAMLGAAHYFERVEGLAPCILCLRQREAYWAALGVALVGLAATLLVRRGAGWVAAVLAGAFLYGAGVALQHVGVEVGWWAGPEACAGGAAAGGPITGDSISEALGAPQTVVRCDAVSWRFAGLSMAGWNLAISLALVAASVLAASGRGPFRSTGA